MNNNKEEERVLWPDTILTTKEAIMAYFPPLHNQLFVPQILEDRKSYPQRYERKVGTILHYLSYSEMDNEMREWMVQYYHHCIPLTGECSLTSLHYNVIRLCYETARLLLIYGPPDLVFMMDSDGRIPLDHLHCYILAPKTIAMHHLLMVYMGAATSHGYDETILDARAACRESAYVAVACKRAKWLSKDIGTLLLEHMWSLRADERWWGKK